MDVKTVLEFQLNGSFKLLKETIEDVTDQEWGSRGFPTANQIGFTLWHCLRTIDWAINRVARGDLELTDRAGWHDLKPERGLFGAGVSKQTADAVASAVSPRRAAEYVEALQAKMQEWFRSLPSADLDGLVDLKEGGAGHPDYLAPAVWAEIQDLDGIPLWQFLARPSVSHIRVHYGEVQAQLEAVRTAGAH
jgi:hypothetical protein